MSKPTSPPPGMIRRAPLTSKEKRIIKGGLMAIGALVVIFLACVLFGIPGNPEASAPVVEVSATTAPPTTATVHSSSRTTTAVVIPAEPTSSAPTTTVTATTTPPSATPSQLPQVAVMSDQKINLQEACQRIWGTEGTAYRVRDAQSVSCVSLVRGDTENYGDLQVQAFCDDSTAHKGGGGGTAELNGTAVTCGGNSVGLDAICHWGYNNRADTVAEGTPTGITNGVLAGVSCQGARRIGDFTGAGHTLNDFCRNRYGLPQARPTTWDTGYEWKCVAKI